MSGLADRIEAARLENASAEAIALVEIERRLRWAKPAGISARDLWEKLGKQGDVASVITRLRSLEEQGKARQEGELWYHASAARPALVPQALAVPGNIVSGSVEDRRGRILAYLREHPEGAKASEVVRALDLSQSTTHNDLMRMQVEGRTRKDHNGVWRLAPLAPPTPPSPSQTDVVAPCTEEPAPPSMQATVEIVAEGEVVATVVEPEPEPDARPDPLALLADLAAAVETLERARREIAEHTADTLIGDTLDEIAAYVGAPDYTDPAEVYRAVVAREEELTSRLYAAREEASALRTELGRIRAALAALVGGGS